MAGETASLFDAPRLLEPLVRCRVQFVIVGGFAGRLHGATRATGDLDICPAWHTQNLTRLSAALVELDATLRLRPELQDATVRPNPELLRAMSVTLWSSPYGNVDVLLGIADGAGTLAAYPELAERATELQLRDATLLVAALEDVICAKEIAAREKDRQALPELRALLGRRHSRDAEPVLAPAPARTSQPSARHLAQRGFPSLPTGRRPGLSRGL